MLRPIVLAVSLAAILPSAADAATVLDVPHDRDARYSLPGTQLAGPDVVLPVPGRPQVRLLPVSGGPGQRIRVRPGLGSVSVIGASAERAVSLVERVVRRGGRFRRSEGLLAGPPGGPFTTLTRCGERATGLIAFDRDRVAYTAVPRPGADCPAGAARLERESVVVRDLAAGGALLAQLPVGGDVVGLELAGTFVATKTFRGQGVTARSGPMVVRALDGRTVTTLPRERGSFAWLGDDGTVVSGLRNTGDAVLRCQGVVTGLRVHAPGDSIGRRLDEAPCTEGSITLRGGWLRFATPRADGTAEVVERHVVTDDRRVLATGLVGQLLDADERTLLVSHARCVGYDLLAVPVDLARPAAAPAVSDCPFGVQVRPRPRGGRMQVIADCPDGCTMSFVLRIGERRVRRVASVTGEPDTRARVALPLPLHGARRATLVVERLAESLPARRRVFAVRLVERPKIRAGGRTTAGSSARR